MRMPFDIFITQIFSILLLLANLDKFDRFIKFFIHFHLQNFFACIFSYSECSTCFLKINYTNSSTLNRE